MIKSIILNCGQHPENVHRLKKKNGDPTTQILSKLKNEIEEQHTKDMKLRLKIKSKI